MATTGSKAIARPNHFNRLALAVAPSIVFLSPTVSFLRHHSYSLWTPEAGLLLLLVIGFGLVVGVFAAISPTLLGPPLLIVTVILAFDLQYRQIDLVDGLFALKKSPLQGALVLFGFSAACSLAWVLRRQLGVIAVTAFSVILLSTVLLPVPSRGLAATGQTGTVDASAKLPILHIIFDEHIAVGALPPEIEGAKGLTEDLKAFYKEHGFTLYGQAFSHLSQTRPSLTALLNGKAAPDASTILDTRDGRRDLKSNAWFDSLGKAGFRIRVYQTNWLNYCGSGLPYIESCTTFDASTIQSLRRLDLHPWTKAKVILNSLLEASSLDPILRRLTQVPEVRLTGFNALRMFEALRDDLATATPGTVYFAHFMLPHYSYVLDETCRPIPDPAAWYNRYDPVSFAPGILNSDGSRARRYGAYFKQLRCAAQLLGDLLTAFSKSGSYDDATIIVHSDHGSRIGHTPAQARYKDKLTDRDLLDHYAALFAYRTPGQAGQYMSDRRSIQALFAEKFLKMPLSDEPNDVRLRGGDFEPGATRWIAYPPGNG